MPKAKAKTKGKGKDKEKEEEEEEEEEEDKTSIYKRITRDHIDALQEIGNIGSGHAANALSELLNRRIDMSLPRFKMLTTTDLSKVDWRGGAGGKPLAVTLIESKGDMLLNILVIFDAVTVEALIKMVRTETESSGLEQLSSLDQSVLREVGNILGLHYLTAINNFLRTKAIPAGPASLVIESSETILTNVATHFAIDFSHVLLIECDIFTSDMKMQPVVILIPEEKTLEALLYQLFGEYM